MRICVCLEIWRCICMEMRDSRRKPPNYSIYSSEKLTDPASFRSVCMGDIAAVEDNVQADIFLYDIDIVDGFMIGELKMRNVRKHSINVRLLRYNCDLRHVSNMHAFFTTYHCPSCDPFIKTDWNIELGKKELSLFFLKTCINCEKHCLTN